MQNFSSKLNFATDAWTSPNHKAYVALTVHLERDGKALSSLLNIVEVARSHSGINLAIVLADVLQTFGIEKKVWADNLKPKWKERLTFMQILSIMADNTSNNDTMVEQLGVILDSFPGAVNQTRWFAHTVNITAKAILKQFNVPKGENDEFLDDAAQAFADLAEELDIEEQSTQETQDIEDDEDDDQPLDSWVDFCGGLTDKEVRELDANIQPVWSMLIKVCWLCD